MRGGRGWHGGISMNDEKDGIVEKACTVWSALGRELRLCLEITKVIRTITESIWRRSNETFAILSASISTFMNELFSVHWKSWWISAGLQIYVQALGNFRDSETPSRQFWNPIHYLSVTSGIWELGIKFFCHSRWHVSKWILCKEKTIAIRSVYRGHF